MKSVIVTGASSGIGRAATVRLAQSGYRVFGLARSYDKLKAMSTELPAENYVPVEFDAARPETFDKTIEGIASEGAVFGLVNNAGYVELGAIEDISMDSLRNQFETSFFGVVGLMKKVLPLMMQSGEGRIVNISSIAGLLSLPLIGAYCASKHALEALADSLRMEFWNTGIKLVNINPGVIETNIHAITSYKAALLTNSRFAQAYSRYLEDAPGGLPTGVVADTIFEAISSPNPKTRYIIGSNKEKIAVSLRPFIPHSVFFSQVAKRVLT